MLMMAEHLWSPLTGWKTGPSTQDTQQQAQGLTFPGTAGATNINRQLHLFQSRAIR